MVVMHFSTIDKILDASNDSSSGLHEKNGFVVILEAFHYFYLSNLAFSAQAWSLLLIVV